MIRITGSKGEVIRVVGNDMASRLLEQGLSVASLRLRVLANNIANANTPGFKRSRVEFEQQLKAAIGASANLAEVLPVVKREVETVSRPDGNNVDIELEMTQLAQTQLYYSALTRQISDHFARLRMVIQDGRR